MVVKLIGGSCRTSSCSKDQHSQHGSSARAHVYEVTWFSRVKLNHIQGELATFLRRVWPDKQNGRSVDDHVGTTPVGISVYGMPYVDTVIW